MVKKIIPGETKEERKLRKARERASQSLSVEVPLLKTTLNDDKKYVICLKWGNKYGPEYVNKLYNMVKRNLTIDYEFVCFTDDRTGIDKHIRTESLPELGLNGWWYKVWLLSNELPIQGTALFFDLDLIVFRNIDNLFYYEPNKEFVIIRDFNRHVHKGWNRMNSSVFRFKIGAHDKHYRTFISRSKDFITRLQGDQDYMYKMITDFTFWPDEWIQSYKWEMRGREHLSFRNGKRNFTKPGVPIINPLTSVAVFHGLPNIPDCVDEWPRANWY